MLILAAALVVLSGTIVVVGFVVADLRRHVKALTALTARLEAEHAAHRDQLASHSETLQSAVADIKQTAIFPHGRVE